jgi:hypothetical protein
MTKDREFVELVKRIHERSVTLFYKLHPTRSLTSRLRRAGFSLVIVRCSAILAVGLALATLLGILGFWFQTLQRLP